MRPLVPISLALVLTASLPAAAEENLLAPSSPQPSEPAVRDRPVQSALAGSRSAELDEWFALLAAAESPMEAHVYEQRILSRWTQSGSATVDLLMAWAAEAMGAKNYPRALDLLDQVIVMKPDYAEGYNRRATVYFVIEDLNRSIADIRTTLALEPRHFGALAGLGAILMRLGDSGRAAEIYERALAINPQMEEVRKTLDELRADDSGSPI